MDEWRESSRKRGNNNEFLYTNSGNLDGSEIYFNSNIERSYMSSYFLSRWQQKNKNSCILFNNGVALLPIKIGGRLYSTYIAMTTDFSPLTLGRDFFQAYRWEPGEEEDEIQTPYGKIRTSGRMIDTDLAEKVFTAEEVTEKKGSREDKIRKLHKYFGHTSGDGLWRVIRNSSNTEGFTKTEIEKICEECQVCQLSRRKANRKKTSLPKSTAFNQVVTMDLKVHGDGTYILWMCDDATRLIKGQVIKNKEPETIIAAMDNLWITGYGMGPGMPERSFFTDNGGEFMNSKLLNLCQEQGISLKKTGSYSPQQNGLNERNHGVTDLMVEKILRDNPTWGMQEAVNKAAWSRNSIINAQRGFSPFQLVFGRNPTLPGASDCTTGGLEDFTGGEISRSILSNMENIRQDMQKAECDVRIKTAMKDNLPRNVDVIFDIGDDVVFKDGKDGKNHVAKIVGFEGPTALLRWGNMDRKVPKRELLPNYEIHTLEDEESQDIETEEKQENAGREKRRKGSSIASSSGEESDMEIIPEIRPRKRGRPRKQKEIIPEISEKKVVREEKRKRMEKEEDEPEEPTEQLWSEDEDETHKKKNHKLTLPNLFKHIKMWNTYGEKFSGQVIAQGKNGKKFRIQEHGTLADLWISLDRLNYWDYTKPPDSGIYTYWVETPSERAQRAQG